MRKIRFLARRLICWLKGHQVEAHRVRKGRMRGVAHTCRRCNCVVAFGRVRLPRMDVPRG